MMRTIVWAVAAVALLLLLGVADAVTLKAGDLLVADPSAYPVPALFRVGPASGEVEIVSSGGSFVDPMGVAVGKNGEIYVADPNASGRSGALFLIDPVTGSQTVVSAAGSFSDPLGVAVAPDGAVYVIDRGELAAGAIIRVDPGTGQQVVVSRGGMLSDPYGGVVGPDSALYVVDGLAYAVIKVDLQTGGQSLVASAAGGIIQFPIGIGLDSDGHLLVSDSGWPAKILHLDPVSGGLDVVTSGGPLTHPCGISVLSSGEIVVADQDAAFCLDPMYPFGLIIGIDPATGAQRTIACDLHFRDPAGLAVVPGTPTPTLPTTWGDLKARYR